MTPREIHNACHKACAECPQFRVYAADLYFPGYGKFMNIPKKGLIKVVKFWRKEKTLWKSGYAECLPNELQEMFARIDVLLGKSLKKAIKKAAGESQ